MVVSVRQAAVLEGMVHHVPDASAQAVTDYFAYTVKPQMVKLRAAVDQAEGLCAVWPMPTYEKVFYSHHTSKKA
jgi:glutamine synthetase type III